MPEEQPPEDRPDTGDAPRERAGEERSGRLYRLGRRILDRGDDVRELASAVLETSDRAKTEMVKMVAREVRTYLDEMKLKEDLHELITKNSLEVHLSFSLKPLSGAEPAAEKAPPPSSKGTGGNG